eukprot:3261796-Rhodomonas_salina.1
MMTPRQPDPKSNSDALSHAGGNGHGHGHNRDYGPTAMPSRPLSALYPKLKSDSEALPEARRADLGARGLVGNGDG